MFRPFNMSQFVQLFFSPLCYRFLFKILRVKVHFPIISAPIFLPRNNWVHDLCVTRAAYWSEQQTEKKIVEKNLIEHSTHNASQYTGDWSLLCSFRIHYSSGSVCRINKSTRVLGSSGSNNKQHTIIGVSLETVFFNIQKTGRQQGMNVNVKILCYSIGAFCQCLRD